LLEQLLDALGRLTLGAIDGFTLLLLLQVAFVRGSAFSQSTLVRILGCTTSGAPRLTLLG
jgi:hypothetical protein